MQRFTEAAVCESYLGTLNCSAIGHVIKIPQVISQQNVLDEGSLGLA